MLAEAFGLYKIHPWYTSRTKDALCDVWRLNIKDYGLELINTGVAAKGGAGGAALGSC